MHRAMVSHILRYIRDRLRPSGRRSEAFGDLSYEVTKNQANIPAKFLLSRRYRRRSPQMHSEAIGECIGDCRRLVGGGSHEFAIKPC